MFRRLTPDMLRQRVEVEVDSVRTFKAGGLPIGGKSTAGRAEGRPLLSPV